MAINYTGGVQVGSSAGVASVTHGMTINAGDLVIAYINCNHEGAIANDAGGTAWQNPINEVPSGETTRQALFWKIAGSEEPASYDWTLPAAASFRAIVKVFTSSTSLIVDTAAVSGYSSGSSPSLICNAIDGQVIADGALSIVFGGKDNRAGYDHFTAADNSYTGVIGYSGSQTTGGAHRIYTTGETFSGSVTLSGPTGPSDATFSIHISFVESAAGNNNPQLGTPHPDITLEEGDIGSVDLSPNFTDADAEPLTYGVNPALPSGFSFNSTTGVLSWDGTQRITAQANYTFSADDGHGGAPATDVIAIEVSTPTGWEQIVFDGSTPTGVGLYAKSISEFGITPALGDYWVAQSVANLIFREDGNFSLDPPASGSFDFKLWDDSAGVYSAVATYNFTDAGLPPVGAIPSVVLTGSASIQVAQGSPWIDPGYTASDAENGDITNNVVVGGDTVDTNTIGVYTITYDVTDSDGNDAPQVTRTVTVVDQTAPIITLNGQETLSITVNSTYNDAGATAVDNQDGDLSGSISIGGDTVDINTEGTYVITYDVQDSAGNAAPQVTRTVNVIPTPPPLDPPSITIRAKGLTLTLSL